MKRGEKNERKRAELNHKCPNTPGKGEKDTKHE
jgi:hypothetical protein